MLTDPDYTLAELASLTGVSPRTIRYYVAQGLLPSPEGAGPATRYPAAALARLKLVRQLQRGHLPLAEIRRRLTTLTDGEIVELAAVPEPAPPADSALEYVRSLLGSEPPLARTLPSAAMRVTPQLLRLSEAPTTYDDLQLPPQGPTPRRMPPGRPPGPAGMPIAERSQWEHIVIEPDVELHVRRPLSRIANKRVERLVAFARQLLEEGTP